MTDFRETLTSVCNALPGAIAATVMGFDGLPVETVETGAMPSADAGGTDVASLLVEYSSVLAQVQRTGEVFAAGPIEEFAIRTENLTTVIRPITQEYFVALAMVSTASLGRGRYLLRVHAPKFAEALA